MTIVPQKSPLLWTRGVAAHETLSYLDRRGIDAEPALFGAGLSRRQLSENDIGVSVASQYRFLELAATEANDHLLGLHVAAEMDMRAIGILFYLAGSSPTVSEALENLAHYSATTNEALVLEIFRHKDEVILAIRHVQEFYEPHQQFFELLALWFIRMLHRQTNVDFAPLRSHLLRILTVHADELLTERHSVTGLQRMVADQLIGLLPSGESRAAAVAQRLNMSTRSFTRQLAKEGTTFGEILEGLRRRLASRYLAHDRMSIKQIAWLLGYSQVGAFNHAYRRWTGTSPARARQKQPPGLP